MAGSTIRIAILANAAKAKAEIDSVTASASKMGARVAAVSVAGLGALAVGAKKAVDAAAEMNDTIGATGVIFGSAADSVVAFSSTTARNLGLSKQAALDAAGTFGTIGKSAGLSGPKLSEFSNQMVQLGGDLASFKGGTAEEAVTAIGAAMRGESEPIRRYGVLLDDATLRNTALKLGLVKTTKEALTPQQKALAAQAAILAQTKDAQGDYARTADSAKNKAQAQAASVADLTAQLGQALLPAYGKVLSIGLQITSWMSEHQKTVTIVVGVLASLAGMVLLVAGVTKVWAAGQVILNAVLAANPVGLVILAIAALVALVVLAYKKSETFRRVVNAVWAAIKSAWGAIPGLVSTVVSKITGFFSSMKAKITGAFVGAKSWLLNAAHDVIQGFLDGLQAGYQRVKDSLSRLTNMLPDWKGPASKDRNILKRSGRLVIGGFQSSLEDGYANVRQSLTGFTDSLGADARINGTVAVGSGGASAAPTVLELRSSGSAVDDLLLELLRKAIRVRGGNVQVVLGRG